MICKLIVSANHLCRLCATDKYMASLDVARRDISAKVKVVLTHDSELSTLTQRKSDVLAEANLMLDDKESRCMKALRRRGILRALEETPCKLQPMSPMV